MHPLCQISVSFHMYSCNEPCKSTAGVFHHIGMLVESLSIVGPILFLGRHY